MNKHMNPFVEFVQVQALVSVVRGLRAMFVEIALKDGVGVPYVEQQPVVALLNGVIVSLEARAEALAGRKETDNGTR